MKPKISIILLLILLTGCSFPLQATPVSPLNNPPTIPPAHTVLPSPTSTVPQDPTKMIPSQTSIAKSPGNAGSLTESASILVENAALLAWSPESNTLMAKSGQKVLILDGSDVSISREIPIPEGTSLLDFNAASQRMALTADRLSLSIRDLSGKEIQTISPSGGFGSASFSPDGNQIWVSSMEEFKAIAFDIRSGKETASCGGFETAAPVYSAFPSPGGNWLVWIARATIQLNHLPDCQTIARIGHEDFIISHTFSHDESILVTSTGGTVNGEFQPLIYFWDTKTAKQTRTIILKESPAIGLAYSPDDTLLASAGSGLFIWDTETGKQIKMLAPVDQRYTGVLFSSDGLHLAATTETGIHLYTVQP